jgi:hypothetical protein
MPLHRCAPGPTGARGVGDGGNDARGAISRIHASERTAGSANCTGKLPTRRRSRCMCRE